MIDKDIEKSRYDNRANIFLDSNNIYNFDKIPVYLNTPYKYYFHLLGLLGENSGKSKLLEIGAGMGENTSLLLDMSFKVTSTDISSKSVKVMKSRFSKNSNFSAKVADMEKLPFNNESFDVVCSAGSLSYGDNNVVMNEIYRVLKQGGVMIAVDSLNNNPIYRFNRYVHYLKGNRSLSVIKRTPDLELLKKYKCKFGQTETRFFGAISYLMPLLNTMFGGKVATKISDRIDALISVKRSAFKFVIVVEKQ